MNNRQAGAAYEEKAGRFLIKNGFKIWERNYRIREGEIDIIGLHEGCIVFVEVKYRKNNTKGMPEDAVGDSKQQKICRVSDYYRTSHPDIWEKQVRFDVIAISGEQISWYRDAFSYRSKFTRSMW